MKEVKTPELDKMLAISEKSQAIGKFLDWCSVEHEIQLAEWTGSSCPECGDETLINLIMGKEKLLAKYFEIDLDKCEQERQQLLANLRSDGR